MTARKVVADTEHTRRAVGWPSGAAGETATSAHVTTTGTAFVAGDDSADRDIREAKWNARDGGTRT